MNRKNRNPIIAGLGILLLGSPVFGEISTNAELSFSNRYVTEGIDNDPDSSAYSFAEVSVETGGFLVGAWYAQSLRGSSENEVNIFAEYGFDLDPLEIFIGLNFLTFPTPDEEDTWEVYLGFEYPVFDHLVLFGETYYDFDEVDGGFLELGFALPFAPEAFHDQFELSPYALIGIDYGFVSGPRRLRENNLQVGLEATYAVTDQLVVFGSAHHSFRLKNLRDEGEGDVTWVAAGLGFSF